MSAVLEHEDLAHTRKLTQRFLKTDEIPFDFVRRRMSVAVARGLQRKRLLITKERSKKSCACGVSSSARRETFRSAKRERRKATDLHDRPEWEGLRVIARGLPRAR